MPNKVDRFANDPVYQGFDKDYENKKKIPRAAFIEDVEKELKNASQAELQKKIDELGEMFQKYTYMNNQLVRNKTDKQQKVPEIKKTLKAIAFLKKKYEESEEVKTNFQLSDNIFVEAKLDKSDKVALWLGAGTMVEYSFDEAIDLLNESLSKVSKQVEELTEDIAFLRDQITTTEVNISRVYNFSVLKNKK